MCHTMLPTGPAGVADGAIYRLTADGRKCLVLRLVSWKVGAACQLPDDCTRLCRRAFACGPWSEGER